MSSKSYLEIEEGSLETRHGGAVVCDKGVVCPGRYVCAVENARMDGAGCG